jgi:hypothetical protein
MNLTRRLNRLYLQTKKHAEMKMRKRILLAAFVIFLNPAFAETYVCSSRCMSGSDDICVKKLERFGEMFVDTRFELKPYKIIDEGENFLLLASAERPFQGQVGMLNTIIINKRSQKFLWTFAGMDLRENESSMSERGICERVDH